MAQRRTESGSVVVATPQRHWLFDRPKPPHDWRWVVGGIGRVLIVVGLLMFAFVAYQLWGTGIYTAQAQNELDDQFASAAIASTPTAETTTTVAPTTTVTAGPAPTSAGATTTTTTTAGPQLTPFPFELASVGDPLVRLQIPSIDVDYKVVQGVGLDQLKKGPGHFPESVLPGQLGNSAIAGHRTTHGGPFYDVDELKPGDTIVLTYPDIAGARGPQFTYAVTGTEIVAPSDYGEVVPTTDPTRATLVLASCHPVTSAKQRIIIRAELDPARSSPLFAATPAVAGNGSQEIPGDDSTTTAASAAAPTTARSATSVAGGATAPGTAPPTTVAAAGEVPPSASADAFAGGWFDDAAAWPQIVLWGLLLAGIAAGGVVLARRQRRIWLGVLVSFVPFVVVLYFWFENVNRLLPPGL